VRKNRIFSIGTGLGQSLTMEGNIYYVQYVSDLEANTNMSANDIAAISTLHPPPSTGLLGNTFMMLTAANLDAIGEHAMAAAVRTRSGGIDCKISLNFSIINVSRPDQDSTQYDLQSVVTHETDEVLGIGGDGSTLYLAGAYSGQTGPTNGVGPLDLYRYVSPGFRSFSLSTNVAPYFSINGGTNVLVHFNQFGSGTDFGDWGKTNIPPANTGNTPPQVQDAIGTPGAMVDLGANEFIALDVVGYTLSGSTYLQGIKYSGGTFTISVATLPGLTYQAQYSTNLAGGSWQNLGSPFVATDITTTITDSTASGTARFYRLIAVPPTGARAAVAHSRPPPVDPAAAPFDTFIAIRNYLPRAVQPAP
jgi:hypothetical protein